MLPLGKYRGTGGCCSYTVACRAAVGHVDCHELRQFPVNICHTGNQKVLHVVESLRLACYNCNPDCLVRTDLARNGAKWPNNGFWLGNGRYGLPACNRVSVSTTGLESLSGDQQVFPKGHFKWSWSTIVHKKITYTKMFC